MTPEQEKSLSEIEMFYGKSLRNNTIVLFSNISIKYKENEIVSVPKSSMKTIVRLSARAIIIFEDGKIIDDFQLGHSTNIPKISAKEAAMILKVNLKMANFK